MKNLLKIWSLAVLAMSYYVSTANAQNQIEKNNETLAKLNNVEGQENTTKTSQKQKVVIVTGARFSYPLVQKWMDDYNTLNPNVQVIIEARGSNDPLKYDVLAEVYEHEEEIKKNSEYLYIARYAILPVANAQSSFAKEYTEKGLNKNLIKQLFFHDVFADKENIKEIKAPYTVYTRLQKAGAPIVFTNYFGHEQKDIKGKAIAGSDEHLLKAILRDTAGVSYLPLALIYDHKSGKVINGLSVLPVDLNGNGKVSTDEKIYADLATLLPKLEEKTAKSLNNLPISHLHLSVDKQNASPEAIKFLKWVAENGQNDLAQFGYLKPEAKLFDKEKFVQLAAKQNK
jgi:ABC-type phosphate transport system substrate-binding protein